MSEGGGASKKKEKRVKGGTGVFTDLGMTHQPTKIVKNRAWQTNDEEGNLERSKGAKKKLRHGDGGPEQRETHGRNKIKKSP